MTIAGQAAVIQRTQKINTETTAHRKPQLTWIPTHGRLPDIQRREKREDYLLPSRLLEKPKTNCLNPSLHNSTRKVLVTLPQLLVTNHERCPYMEGKWRQIRLTVALEPKVSRRIATIFLTSSIISLRLCFKTTVFQNVIPYNQGGRYQISDEPTASI